MSQLLVPVHIGSEPPEFWDDIESRQRKQRKSAGAWLRDRHRPTIAQPSIDLTSFGFEPRWIGYDAADCAVALSPSIYSGQGAVEFERFREGATNRGEVALVISPIGDLAAKPRSIFDRHDDGLSVIGGRHTTINSSPIGKGARVRAAADLGDADGQLALRLLSSSPAPIWRTLSLSGATINTVYGQEQYRAEGTLLPILETELGEPVVAIWESPDGLERRYIVPVETPWPLLLQWLLEQALPEFSPGALRRARRPLAAELELMTRNERESQLALKTLEANYVASREELQRELEAAQSAASPIRESLLYGTGHQLVNAVRSVFAAVGIEVVDLDQQLGGTKNADLLCSYRGRSRLVEVKSASGRPTERSYQDLIRHLREWPHLPGSTPVEGGALVMSHEIRTPPLERNPSPYNRPEFLAAQNEPVISVLDLFDAWRQEDAEAVRKLLFGMPNQKAQQSPIELANKTRPENQAKGFRRWFNHR